MGNSLLSFLQFCKLFKNVIEGEIKQKWHKARMSFYYSARLTCDNEFIASYENEFIACDNEFIASYENILRSDC